MKLITDLERLVHPFLYGILCMLNGGRKGTNIDKSAMYKILYME